MWAGRHEQLTDWRDRLRPRRVAGQYERGRALLGEPGIGKSVLVRRIANDAVRRGDLATRQVRIPRGANPLALLSDAALELADASGITATRDRKLGELLDRVRAVSVMGAGVTVDPASGQPAHRALTDLLVEIARHAAGDDKAVIVHLDEAQNITDDDLMSQTLVALGDALAHEEPRDVPGGTIDVCVPLVVYLTGMPEFADAASTRIGATFARRFHTTVLDPISDDDLHTSLRPFVVDGWPVRSADGDWAAVTIAPDAAARIIDLCHGDPFLFQLAGQAAWDAADSARIDLDDVARGWRWARGEARRHVERQLERLPDVERAMVEALAALPGDARTLTRIDQEMGYDSGMRIGSSAQRLDTVRGIISRGRRYAFRARTVEAYLSGDWP